MNLLGHHHAVAPTVATRISEGAIAHVPLELWLTAIPVVDQVDRGTEFNTLAASLDGHARHVAHACQPH